MASGRGRATAVRDAAWFPPAIHGGRRAARRWCGGGRPGLRDRARRSEWGVALLGPAAAGRDARGARRLSLRKRGAGAGGGPTPAPVPRAGRAARDRAGLAAAVGPAVPAALGWLPAARGRQ